MADIRQRLSLLKSVSESMELLSSVRDQVTIPFDFIEGLNDIGEVKTVSDLERLLEASFSITTWTDQPYNSEPLAFLKNYSALNYLYWNLTHRKIGGWCGIAAEVFIRLLYGYGLKCWPFNYGLKGTDFTHMVVMVEFQGKKYLFDPYFGKYYIKLNGTLITYDELFAEVVNKTYGFEEVRVGSRKMVKVGEDQWVDMGSVSFEEWSQEGLYLKGLDYELKKRDYTRPIDLIREWTEMGEAYIIKR